MKIHVDIPDVTSPSPPSQSLQAGDDLVLYCSYDGLPLPVVQWLHNGDTIKRGDVDILNTDSSSSGFSRLWLRDVQQVDGGTYSCVVSNKLGSSEINFDTSIKSKNIIRFCPYRHSLVPKSSLR